MRAFRLVIATAVVAAVAAAAGWYMLRPAAVLVAMPSRGDAAEVVYASGIVEPRVWAKVTPLIRERIVWHCNCEGERVAKGDELARLDDTEAKAALGELRARLALAEEELRRHTALSARNVVSQQELDRARSEVVQLEALVAGQQARLDSYILRSPSDGMVLRRDGEVGEIAELGAALFWVGEPSPLIVVADVNEEDIPRIVVGQNALLRSDAFPGRQLDAEVDSITPKGDPVTKTYRVRFRLPDDTPLRIGMSTDVNAIVRVSRNALLLPSVAVENSRVFVVDGDRAYGRDIRTGIRGPQGIEVLSGIDETTLVITPHPANLTDGARVKVSDAKTG
ncbi:RND transporter [Rhizobium sp. YS-1r]|nr:RND transporter [Rhizobium sp. YS-1r]